MVDVPPPMSMQHNLPNGARAVGHSQRPRSNAGNFRLGPQTVGRHSVTSGLFAHLLDTRLVDSCGMFWFMKLRDLKNKCTPLPCFFWFHEKGENHIEVSLESEDRVKFRP